MAQEKTLVEEYYNNLVKKFKLKEDFNLDKDGAACCFVGMVKKQMHVKLNDAELTCTEVIKTVPGTKKKFKNAVYEFSLEYPETAAALSEIDCKPEKYGKKVSTILASSQECVEEPSEPNILEKIVYTPIVAVMDFCYDHF